MEPIQIVSAFLTPVIAVVTTYIAIQQYRTNRLKYKLELFERRYEIYQAVKEFIRVAVRDADLSDDVIIRLNEQTQDAFFLCGESVEEYIDELRSKGARLMYLNTRLSDQSLGRGGERSRLAKEDAEILTWFGKQLGHSKKVFKPYLRVHF